MKYMLALYPPSAEGDDTIIVEDTPENRKLYEAAEKLIGGFDSPEEAFAQAMDYTREEDERGECPLIGSWQMLLAEPNPWTVYWPPAKAKNSSKEIEAPSREIECPLMYMEDRWKGTGEWR